MIRATATWILAVFLMALPAVVVGPVVVTWAGDALPHEETPGNGRTAYRKCRVQTVKAISNRRIFPDSSNINEGEYGGPLTLSATPGEYESASFVVTAEEPLKNLRLEVGVLETGGGKRIPASAVDIKVVKVWYQDPGKNSEYREQTPPGSYSPISATGKKVLVPELLLHDDGMIKVDTETKHNYIKLGGPEGTQYVCISKPEGVPGKTIADFPIWDSKTLLPVNIPDGKNKQFWVTVHVPEDAAPGTYTTEIRLTEAAGFLGAVPLKVHVLPFKLSPSRFIGSIYYYGPCKHYYGDKQMEQFRKELENLHAHSIDDIYFPFSIFADKEAFDFRKAADIHSKTLFYRGWYPHSAKTADEVKRQTKMHVDELKKYGIEEVYFYGKDEAKGEKLAAQRETWKAVHDGGGKIFVAGYTSKTHPPGNFALMGDIQDMLVCALYPDREEARKWHGKNHKIVCYANPQSGVEEADTYRRNFGFLLWQNEYDGAMTYIYHWGAAQRGLRKPGSQHWHLPSTWNDFCCAKYKQHNMVYPTADGVVDTLQWEGYREAADDLRYMSTLLELIEQNAASSSPSAGAVGKAKEYLAALREKDVNKDRMDMDAIRTDVIRHILAITNTTSL